VLAALPAAFSLQRKGFVLVVADLETVVVLRTAVDPGTAGVVAGPGTVAVVVAGPGTAGAVADPGTVVVVVVDPGTVVVAVEQHQFAVGELEHHSTY